MVDRTSEVWRHISRLMQQSPDAERWGEFLRAAVAGRRNIVISGGTNTGKITARNALLLKHIPRGERIVTIENCGELKLACNGRGR